MSLKSIFMPALTSWWLSAARLGRQRAAAERSRKARGRRHTVHYFHQVDDPYSALMVQCLPRLTERYDLDLQAHLVSPPSDAAAPDRNRLIAYSRKDAAWLATRFGLDFMDHGQQPSPDDLNRLTAQSVQAIEEGQFFARGHDLCASLWNPAPEDDEPPSLASCLALPIAFASDHQVQTHLQASDALRQRWGHYNGGMLYYAGEWYWGIDRLHHLETRLQGLGAARAGTTGWMFPPEDATGWPEAQAGDSLEFFFSLRSPYSYIAAQRLFALTKDTGIQVKLRYVLPMVMRGLAVPRNKRMYISQDAAREALRFGIPFGRICDPVGKPTERGLALMPLAESQGKGQAFVLSFMRGVWAEGLDAGSDSGLKKIIERAGLAWPEVCVALENNQWRQMAENNRKDMLTLGLWGVPGFQLRDTVVWGQDRLAALEMTLHKDR
jgi:2-hydroxychromene-2-carboxylate isomerase